MGDTIVGQNLKVGNYIAPKTGSNLNLSADTVNMSKDLNVTNSVTANNATLQSLQSGTGSFSGNVSVEGNTSLNGALYVGKTATFNKLEITNGTILKGLTEIANTALMPGGIVTPKIFSTQVTGMGSTLNLNTMLIQRDAPLSPLTINTTANSIQLQQNTNITKNLHVDGAATAKSVGSYKTSQGSASVAGPNSVGAPSTATCKINTYMTSCNISSPSNTLMGTSYMLGSQGSGQKCVASATNTSASKNATYYAEAVCFDPSTAQ